MFIFGNNVSPVTESTTEIEVPVYEGHLEPTVEGFQSILLESHEEMYRAQATLYISDILMEEAVFEGTSEPEPLMEAFAQDQWERLKKIFVTLKSKVKAWFDAFVNQVKMRVTSGAKFVETYANELHDKDTADFTYNAYPYSKKEGDSKLDEISGKLQKALDGIDLDLSSFKATTAENHEGKAKSQGPTSGDDKAKLFATVGAENSGALAAMVRRAYQGGTEKEQIKGFSKGASKEEMISLVKNLGNVSAISREQEKQINAQNDLVLRAMAKARSAVKDNAHAVAVASHRYNVAHTVISMQSTVSMTAMRAIQEMASAYEAILKKLLRSNSAKAAKEALEVEPEEVNENTTTETDEAEKVQEPDTQESAVQESAVQNILSSVNAWL